MERRAVLHLFQIAMTIMVFAGIAWCIVRESFVAWPMIKRLLRHPEPAGLVVNYTLFEPLVAVVAPCPLPNEEIALAA